MGGWLFLLLKFKKRDAMRLPCVECPFGYPGQVQPCVIGPDERARLRTDNNWDGVDVAMQCKEDRIRDAVVPDALTKLNSLALLKSLVEARFDHAPRREDAIEVEAEPGRKELVRSFLALFVDLDDFGKGNKKYGHDSGDRVLIATAEKLVSITPESNLPFGVDGALAIEDILAIESITRKSDLWGRRSGDEFVGLLPGVPRKRAGSKLEEVREICRRGVTIRTTGGVDATFTASVGGAYVENPRDARDVFYALSIAGESLMPYKDGGKQGSQPDLVIVGPTPEDYTY